MADFSNLSDAFNAGNQAAQGVTDNWRKNQAMNALAKIYGPVAGDPTAAAAMQSYDFNKQANPLKLQQAQQDLNLGSQLDPLKVQAQQIQNQEGVQQVDGTALTQQQAQAAQLHGVLSGSLGDLKTSLANVTDPTQRGALFDAEVQKVAPLLGVDPRVAASQLAQERRAIVANGADAVDGLQTTLDNVATAGLSPIDKQKMLNAQATGALTQQQTELSKANTEKAQAQTAATTAKAAAAGGAPQQKIDTLTFFNTSAQTALDTANQALDQLESTNDYGPIRGLASKVPGSPEYKFAQSADQLSHALSISDLRNLKASGVSLGRTTNAEFLAASKALANLDLGQDKATIKKNLERVRDMYQDMVNSGTAQLSTLQGAAGAGGTDTGGAAASGAGTTYTYNPATGALE